MAKKIQLRKASEVVASQLQNPEVRTAWDRTAVARAVAVRVTAYRAEHVMSQTELGRRLDMTQPAIARIEAGERVPTIDTLVRLSDALGIEFALNIVPPAKDAAFVCDEAEHARVVERAMTSRGGHLLLAVE